MELQVNYINQILIFVIFAASLNLLMGYLGQVSVAHGAFGAFGGYSLAYLFLNHGFNTLEGLGVGLVVAALGGVVVGFPALRLTTEWLILLTLAAQIIVIALVSTSSSFGGTYGLQNVAGLSVFGHKLLQPTDMLPLFAACAVVTLLICWRVGESPYGRVLRGIREDELACRALGKNVYSYKMAVFSLTAAMAGLAGVLYVVTIQIASPQLFSFDLSTTIVAMVIFGGMGNLIGSVLGATALVLLTPFFENVLSFDAQKASLWRLLAYGIVLVVVMMLRPQGLLPEGAAPIRWTMSKLSCLRGHRPAAVTPAVAAAGPGGAGVPVPEETAHGAYRDPTPIAADEHSLAGVHIPVPATVAVAERADTRPAGEPVLQVTGLSKRFGGIVAAEDLDIELRRGTITALVGPNGAGKTTVYNLLTGAIPPDRGTVILNGEDISGLRPDQVALKGMARSFQDVRVFPRLSVLQNIMLAVPGQPGEKMGPLFFRMAHTAQVERQVRDHSREWLHFVGLDEFAEYPAGALAFGQQKLVALARVLASEADVLLLDEPASGIDQQWVDVMLTLIERMRDQGRTVCIVEHNLHVVGRLADHVYFMELGRITAQGTFEELTGEKRLAEAYFGIA